MIRTAVIALSLTATAFAAVAMVPSSEITGTHTVKETVIEKNQAWPNVGPLVFEDCQTATCEG